MQDNKIKIVGILRGGSVGDYEKSLREGGEIISLIHENLSDKWKPADILIDKNGIWHFRGIPIKPIDLINKVDVIWNASNSFYTNIIENISLPYVGHSIFSKTIKESKEMLKEHMNKIGIKIPRHFVIPAYQEDFDARPTERGQSFGRGDKEKYINKKVNEVLYKFPAPWIIKTFTPDSNTAIHLVKTYPELIDAISDVVSHNKSILVEEFISGKITQVHSVSGFREKEIYTFPSKGFSEKEKEKEKLNNLAKEIHKHLGIRHYLRSDFIFSKKGDIYLINVELVPDFRKDSYFDQSCKYVGTEAHFIIDHILESVL